MKMYLAMEEWTDAGAGDGGLNVYGSYKTRVLRAFAKRSDAVEYLNKKALEFTDGRPPMHKIENYEFYEYDERSESNVATMTEQVYVVDSDEPGGAIGPYTEVVLYIKEMDLD